MLSRLFSLSLALPLAAWAGTHDSTHHNRHHEIAKRAAGSVELHKRFDNSRWTFYDVGLGACGKTNVASDFIVALNSAQFGGGFPGPNCFKTISMTFNGKTTTAKIMDECPGCPYGGLDLSRGLFTFFASESAGVLNGNWEFTDGGDGGDGGKPPPPPPPTSKWTPPATTKATTTWTPEPTTTWKPEPTTTWTPEPTTSKEQVTSSSATTTSFNSTTTSTSKTSSATSANNTAAVVPPTSTPQNLNAIGRFFLNLGGIIAVGAAA